MSMLIKSTIASEDIIGDTTAETELQVSDFELLLGQEHSIRDAAGFTFQHPAQCITLHMQHLVIK